MHIVYKITFNDRKDQNKYPYYYIGSKSNCQFINGKIIGRDKKEYFGSSRHHEYKDALENDKNIVIEIMHTFDNYKDALAKEDEVQRAVSVVTSKEYFNLAYSQDSAYTDPDYATMIHQPTGKICRIHKNEITDDFVGVSKGRSWYNDGKNNKTFFPESVPNGWVKGRIGVKNNPNNFYKNKNKDEIIRKSVEARMNNGSYVAHNKGVVGVVKASDETKQKMRDAYQRKLEKGIYVNPSKGKRWCNNGSSNLLINHDDPLPQGYVYGQLKKKRCSK
jgi:hypothetical protein